MTNRREFLQAAAASTLPVVASAATAANRFPRQRGPLPVPIVLFDARHPESRAVGAHLAADGATVHVLPEGDITQIWLQQIRPLWTSRATPVGGLTARPALFCLEQLAFSCGLRVTFHAEHVIHADGSARHAVLRATRTPAVVASDLDRSGRFWPALIAEALQAHGARIDGARFGPSVASLAPDLPRGARLLTSWIIAAA